MTTSLALSFDQQRCALVAATQRLMGHWVRGSSAAAAGRQVR
jgi:hypothetical protein